MPRLPSLFVSHGAPTLATEPSSTAEALTALGQEVGRPTAIVIASAHWHTEAPAVTGAAHPATIHDFGGFGPELHAMRYPAPGSPALARTVAGLLGGAAVDEARGFDHGVWVPLSRMYPDASVPTVAVAVQSHLGPAHHLALGQALRPLREQGVLVIGSGSMTHNLREFFGAGASDPYAAVFADWVADAIARNDVDALLDYRARAPHAVRAHPTDEHFLPLFVALGAGGPGRRLHSAIDGGILAMDAYAFD